MLPSDSAAGAEPAAAAVEEPALAAVHPSSTGEGAMPPSNSAAEGAELAAAEVEEPAPATAAASEPTSAVVEPPPTADPTIAAAAAAEPTAATPQEPTSCSVKLWPSVIRFSSVCNVNHGPFRSGCWGKGRQATARRIENTRTSRDAGFRRCAVAQARLLGLPEPTSDADFEVWWHKMINARTNSEAGQVLKFARWSSIPECFEHHRPEIFLEKYTLAEMGHTDSQSLMMDQLTTSTSMHDSELAKKMTTSGGLLQRTPEYISEALCLHLDIFVCVTKPLARLHSQLTSEIKSIEDGFNFALVDTAEQGWLDVILDVIANSTTHIPHLQRMRVEGDDIPEQEKQVNAQIVLQFLAHVLSEYVVRFYPSREGPIGGAIRLLHKNKEGVVGPALDDYLHQCKIISVLEACAAKGDESAKRVLAACHIRKMAVLRLLWAYIEHEVRTGCRSTPGEIGPITRHHL